MPGTEGCRQTIGGKGKETDSPLESPGKYSLADTHVNV